jgi:hypothetical protein
MTSTVYATNEQVRENQPLNNVKEARAELLAALSEFDTTAGKVPVTRLANAIEDLITARLAAMR